MYSGFENNIQFSIQFYANYKYTEDILFNSSYIILRKHNLSCSEKNNIVGH